MPASFFGAIAFAFVSYNIVIIAAGHISKGLVMAMMAPALAGVILIYKRNYLLGSLMTLLSVGLSVYFTHQQISYYIIRKAIGIVITRLFDNMELQIRFLGQMLPRVNVGRHLVFQYQNSLVETFQVGILLGLRCMFKNILCSK